MTINPGDNVTINAKVVDITSSGNLIVKLKKGNRVLVCPDEINTANDPIKKVMETDGTLVYNADGHFYGVMGGDAIMERIRGKDNEVGNK